MEQLERRDVTARPWWRESWPLGRREWLRTAVAFVAVVAIFTVVGLALSEWLAPNVVTEADVEIAESFVDARSDGRTDMARWASFLSDTGTKVVVTLCFAGAALARWRRWHEAVLISLSLTFEASAFVVISHIVGRPRPDVDRLLDSPIDTSFPSGHVAAATVYLALAVVVAWHARTRWAPVAAAVACIAVILLVSTARLYQGMHYLSDVAGGVALGLATVAVCSPLVRHSTRAPLSDHPAADRPDGAEPRPTTTS